MLETLETSSFDPNNLILSNDAYEAATGDDDASNAAIDPHDPINLIQTSEEKPASRKSLTQGK